MIGASTGEGEGQRSEEPCLSRERESEQKVPYYARQIEDKSPLSLEIEKVKVVLGSCSVLLLIELSHYFNSALRFCKNN